MLMETMGHLEAIWPVLITQLMKPLAYCMGKKEFYCRTGGGSHLWLMAIGKCPQMHMHTHTLLNFSTSGNNILAFFEYEST